MKTLMQFFGVLIFCSFTSGALYAQDSQTNKGITVNENASIDYEKGELEPPAPGYGGPGLGFTIHIFPNPGNGQLTLSLPGNRGHMVRISNLMGTTYYLGSTMAGQNTLNIDISSAPAGIYRVQVDEQIIKYQKF